MGSGATATGASVGGASGSGVRSTRGEVGTSMKYFEVGEADNGGVRGSLSAAPACVPLYGASS
eukprot:6180808-Pleurochrysis_carterae.AAC.4